MLELKDDIRDSPASKGVGHVQQHGHFNVVKSSQAPQAQVAESNALIWLEGERKYWLLGHTVSDEWSTGFVGPLDVPRFYLQKWAASVIFQVGFKHKIKMTGCASKISELNLLTRPRKNPEPILMVGKLLFFNLNSLFSPLVLHLAKVNVTTGSRRPYLVQESWTGPWNKVTGVKADFSFSHTHAWLL